MRTVQAALRLLPAAGSWRLPIAHERGCHVSCITCSRCRSQKPENTKNTLVSGLPEDQKYEYGSPQKQKERTGVLETGSQKLDRNSKLETGTNQQIRTSSNWRTASCIVSRKLEKNPNVGRFTHIVRTRLYNVRLIVSKEPRLS
jgi:hypothetical protein